MERPEYQYLRHMQHIRDHGIDLQNDRTGVICRTVICLDMTYDATTTDAPILTTRKMHIKAAIAELLGYLKGYTSAEQFASLGTNSWKANANENDAWLKNPNRRGEDDLGLIYGAVAKNWPILGECSRDDQGLVLEHISDIDLVRKVYENLRAGRDDRGEIITFWNPGLFGLGCLRPCMYEHQFSLVNGELYLNSTQRSADWALGTSWNMVQVWLLLRLMAQITGHTPKTAYHRNVNCHLYHSHLDRVDKQLSRAVLAQPTIEIDPSIKTLEDVETWVTPEHFHVHIPETHGVLNYPMAV